jgi:nucleotide-binding universal stress UspA family protein
LQEWLFSNKIIPAMEFKKILIATDHSANAIRAAKTGFALAHQLRAKLALVYVVDKSREVVNADLGITPEQSGTVLLNEAETTLEQLIKMYNGIEEIFRFTPEGSPEKEILKIAREWNADLIVTGPYQRSGLSRLLSGSITEYIIKHTEIPVLVTPAAAIHH